ncbi:hypothetical protein L6241_02185 [Janibacter sp. Y6]|uniref:hypothetical protein n=1 Tax=Janibacter sp. Y6 TaxID=2913552 RepID=UPI0034A295D4
MKPDVMRVDCRTCPVQGIGCDDCMVTALLDPRSAGVEPELAGQVPLDAAEREAVGRLVAAGLVSAGTADRAVAQREPWSQWELMHRGVG